MALKSDAKFEKKLICYFKKDKNSVNLDLSTRNSQNFHFDWLFLCKVYNVWPKTRFHAQDTKKLSCPATIILRGIVFFTGFKVRII